MEQKIPAISVVIPMYNLEKFIVPCLESLLAQTFRDFEVILVDHASTDKSHAKAESCAAKFKEAGIDFHLRHLKENFGNPCLPRNTGLEMSRGKYVYFMDGDDLLTKNALADFYRYAETEEADVVYTPKYFIFDFKADNPFPTKLKIFANPHIKPEFADITSWETENLAERLPDMLNGKFGVMPWLKFSRRDLLIENEISFPLVYANEDAYWTADLILSAKKILIIPDALYIKRENQNSVTRNKKSAEDILKFFLHLVILGPETMKRISEKHPVFRETPTLLYDWINNVSKYGFAKCFNACAKLQPYEVYKLVYDLFGDKIGEHAELISFLCSMINTQQKMLAMANGKIAALEKKLAER